MTIAYWCVVVAIFLPYIFTVLAKTGSGFDNHNPRKYLSELTGWRYRANQVQLNSFEALPAFGLAVIIAHLLHAAQSSLDTLALSFIIARVIYGICYISDRAALRTLAWGAGMACVIGIFCISVA